MAGGCVGSVVGTKAERSSWSWWQKDMLAGCGHTGIERLQPESSLRLLPDTVTISSGRFGWQMVLLIIMLRGQALWDP